MRRHYEAVAEASPIPILIYKVPRFTGVNLPIDLVVNLAQHPNIIGIKDGSGQLIELREKEAESMKALLGRSSFGEIRRRRRLALRRRLGATPRPRLNE
ncbi:dihydrodipicolinate synthase family protein [candidate division KSB1 bacterium]|nr:dihydrodipicolinate synthase family protein [candidate division KSB1 bacterium]